MSAVSKFPVFTEHTVRYCVLEGLSFKSSIQVIPESLDPIGLDVFWRLVIWWMVPVFWEIRCFRPKDRPCDKMVLMYLMEDRKSNIKIKCILEINEHECISIQFYICCFFELILNNIQSTLKVYKFSLRCILSISLYVFPTTLICYMFSPFHSFWFNHPDSRTIRRSVGVHILKYLVNNFLHSQIASSFTSSFTYFP